MPTAVNPKTGEIRILDQSGQWVAPPRAMNPETGAQIYHDGTDWKPLPYEAQMPERLRGRWEMEQGRGLTGTATAKAQEGAMMGFGDEAGAGVSAFLGSVGDILRGDGWNYSRRYDEDLAYQRALAQRRQEKNPILSTVSQVLGGVASLGPGRGAAGLIPPSSGATAPTLGQVATKGAVTGGAAGGVAGFGAGEGGFENRMESAAIGGGIGATLGAATPYVIEGGRRLTDYVRGALGIGDQIPRAERLVIRALNQDQLTPDDILARQQAAQAAGGKGEMLADLGGENTKRLTRAAGTVPGEGTRIVQDAVEARNAAQGDRILNDVKTYLSPIDDFHGAMDALGVARSRAARPAYDAAMEVGPVSSDRLQQFLKDPLVKEALPRGVEIQRLGALAEGRPFNPTDIAEVGVGGALKVPQMGKVPNMRSLDAVKQGLDDILEQYRDKVTGRLVLDARGREIEAVRRAFVEELDNLNPLYREARNAWAGPSKAMDAMNFGRREVLLRSTDKELLAKRLAAMTDSEREFVKAGTSRALADIINNKADYLDVTKGLLANKAARDKIRLIMGDDATFEAFVAAIERERDLFKTGAFVSPRTGSQTQLRQADAAQLLEEPGIVGDVVPALLQGNLRGAAMRAVAGQLPRITEGAGNKTAAELARILATPGNAEPAMQRLLMRAAADRATRNKMADFLALTSAAGGRQAGLIAGP